jgi:hypothetical protein
MAYVSTTPTQAWIVLGTTDSPWRLEVPVSEALFHLCAHFTPQQEAAFLRVLTLVLQSSAEVIHTGQPARGMTPVEPVDTAAS